MNAVDRIPWVTLLLLGANISVAFATLWQPEVPALLGFNPESPSALTALTSLFLHSNTLHLLGNMVFLAAVGPAVEALLRPGRIAAIYFAGGLAGIATHAMVASRDEQTQPIVGASGAVAAFVAVFSVYYIHLRVPLAPRLQTPVAIVTGLWVVLQLLGAFVRIGAGEGGTAFWSHIGGVAAGLLLALLFRSARDVAQKSGHEVLSEMAGRSPAAVLAAAEEHLRKHPGDVQAMKQRADALATLGEAQDQASALVGLLDTAPESEWPQLIASLASCDGMGRLPSQRRALLAERLRSSSPGTAILLLQSVVDGSADDPQRPDALLALAGLRREADPAPAHELVAELLDRYPLHPAAELARARGWDA